MNNTWSLTDANAGTLKGSTAFAGIESLIGGKAADVFQVRASGSLSGLLDGGLDVPVTPGATVAADDTLDYSLRGSAVDVNLALAQATAIAEFSGITIVVGSGADGDTLTGPDLDTLDSNGAPLSTLEKGTRVRIVAGTLAGEIGEIYEYIGTTRTDSDLNTAGNQPFDLAVQPYDDTSLWQLVDNDVSWTVSGPNAARSGASLSGHSRT